MNEPPTIVQQVYQAKENIQAADQLIRAYLPFIKAETAKYLHHLPLEGYDDELSIAMIAFHEAIGSYSRLRGSFLKYAALLIRSRLIDYTRRESRHGQNISLDAPIGDGDSTLSENLPDKKDPQEESLSLQAAKSEISHLAHQMGDFGITLNDVTENCPRQQRTLQACQKAIAYARTHPELLDALVNSRRLPMAQLAQGSGVERKTLERHRKYLVAMLLAYTNGYEIIRGHLQQMQKGESLS